MRWLGIVLMVITVSIGQASLVPMPKQMERGTSEVRKIGNIRAPKALTPVVEAFRTDWPALQSAGAGELEITLDPKLGEESYRIHIAKTTTIQAGGATGVAWALQSLGQTLHTGSPITKISDAPDMEFRTVMIDVARRYHSPSTLRRIVRWAQIGKIRYLQLHLTDDQNWMLPTTVLAGVDARNTHKRPAYTREELTELQAYATARGVTLIPEVDLPGHSTLLCAFDPDVYRIQGSPSTNCINFASPKVREALTTLIDEIAELFPNAPYIHLGGDEAWYPDTQNDPHFKAAGKPADQVFVDFLADLSKRVVRHGRIPLVWEGFRPSEGQYALKTLPKELVVIAWENHYYPADQLLKDGFRIVNAGWDPGYVVNHYPWDAFTLVPLPRMYAWDPRVFGLVVGPYSTRLGDSPNVIGGLMCWWEGHEWNAQRILPARIATFGARLWNAKGERDYAGFMRRVEALKSHVDRTSFPFGMVLSGPADFTDTLTVGALSDRRTVVRFRTDGQVPQASDPTGEIKVTESGIITAQAFREGHPVGETQFIPVHKTTLVPNLALGKPVTTSSVADPDFPVSLITDGIADNIGAFWLSYPLPAEATIDLGQLTDFNRIEVVAFWAAGQAARYRVQVSDDGRIWREVIDAGENKEGAKREGYVHTLAKQRARYIRLQVTGSDQHPATMGRIHEVRVFMTQ